METQAEYLSLAKDYYNIPRMSNSAMSHFRKSPKHYLHYISQPQEETEAMIFGRAFHCAVLEPDNFSHDYAVMPNIDRRTKEGKEKYEQFKAEAGSRTVLTIAQRDHIVRMSEALYAHRPSRELIDAIGETEKPVLWKDEITKVEMKAKLDAIGPNFILDLKTTQDAQPEEFARSAWYYNYHRQAAVYLDGLQSKSDFYFIAIEKEEPHGISVLKCTAEFIQKGREQYEQILQDFIYWQSQGSPNVGYEFRNPFNVFDLNVPNYIKP